MAPPEYLYFALMFLVALPTAWLARSWIALLVFGVWALGQALYLIGLPEPQTQTVIYVAALLLGLRLHRSSVGLFATVLFFPLAVTCASELGGLIDSNQAWWTIYWLALAQALSLPFIIDRAAARTRWRGRFTRGGGGMLFVAHA